MCTQPDSRCRESRVRSELERSGQGSRVGRRGQEGIQGGGGSKDGQDVDVAGRGRALPDPPSFGAKVWLQNAQGPLRLVAAGCLGWGETGRVIQNRPGPDPERLEKLGRRLSCKKRGARDFCRQV